MEVSLLFEYLQAAVGNRKSLSVSVTDADWYRLFEFCKKQALIGVTRKNVWIRHRFSLV